MSYLQKAKDFRDRIQGKPQSGVIRTGIRSFRNAGRRPGGSASAGGKSKPGSGINLQYKNLQPDREFEAVLDDIDASSEPLFTNTIKGPNRPVPPPATRSDGSTAVGHRNPSIKAKRAADTDALFPSSHEEDDDRSSHKVDPLLGVVMVAETDSCRTDSEEESDDLELDAETVDVLESLHLTSKASSSEAAPVISGGSLMEGGNEGGERVEAGSEEVMREEDKSRLGINNKSANNNTHIHKKEETGEAIATAGDAHYPNVTQTENRDTHNHSTKTGVAMAAEPDQKPTLDDLLEYGSAALPSHSSPHPHRRHMSPPPHSPPESSTSPLTSSNETDTHTHISTSIRSQHAATTSDVTGPSTAPQPQAAIASHKHRETGNSDGGIKEGPSPMDIPAQSRSVQTDRVRGDDSLGLSPASDHPLDHSEEEEEVPLHVSAKEKPPYKSRATAEHDEDELFPDDAKLLQDTVVPVQKNSGQLSQNNRLEIRENYFSSSPGEQRKKTESHLTSDPAASSRRSPGRQNSSGKVAPPRPPQSPQLVSRLKLRQVKEDRTHSNSQLHTRHKPPTGVRSDNHTERDGVRSVQARVGGSEPSNEVNHSEVRGSLASEITSPPAESITSSVNSVFCRSVTSPLSPEAVEEQTTSLTTSQQQTGDKMTDSEQPLIPLSVHLLIVGLLYFYYTFNPFVYVAGLLAGFLTFYLCLGTVFVAYVQKEEENAEAAVSESTATELSPGFMKSMNMNLDDYKTRFVVSSKPTVRSPSF